MNISTLVILTLAMAVHASGAIRPATTQDSRLRCGSVLCQVVSELFSKSKLSYGYNYVTTIGAGAMNVTIKQLARSDNLLALKSTEDLFIINGNGRGSESGLFEYNGDHFEYNREAGVIMSKGPLSRAVIVMLYVRGLNTGIKYDYTLPVPSHDANDDDTAVLPTQWNDLGQAIVDETVDFIDSNAVDAEAAAIGRARDRKRRKFSWKLLGFGPCSRSCGPGVQQPIFRCIRDSATRYYTPKRCALAEKPAFSEDIYQCNRGLCAAYWRATDYDECACNADEAEGVRKRRADCVQEQNTGHVEKVAVAACADQRSPELLETCICPRHLRRKIFVRGSEKAAKVYARLIGTAATVRNGSSAPLRRQLRDDRVDKSGVWLMSDWNRQECATSCDGDVGGGGVGGGGFEQRSIYCDRTAPYTDLCDLRFTPEQKRLCGGECHGHAPNHGVWFTSEWSNCTGDCFRLQRSRIVLCLLDGVVVENERCPPQQRPLELRNCTAKEVHFCGPKWHYSDWSECSRACGEGVQRRYAKCLDYDWEQRALVEANNCRYIEREPVYGVCNVHKCDDELEDTVDIAHSGETSAASNACEDHFSSCRRITGQRLCRLSYYKTYCCASCKTS